MAKPGLTIARIRGAVIALSAAALVGQSLIIINRASADDLPVPTGQLIYSTSAGDQVATALNPDGTDQRTVLPSGVRNVRYTPDGGNVMFGQAISTPNDDVWTETTNGYGLADITADNTQQDTPIAWSSDGSKIAYKTTRTIEGVNTIGLYVMNADGSDVRLIRKQSEGKVDAASFSPDGSQIVISGSGTSSGAGLVAVYHSDGTGLITTLGGGFNPKWSPDGTRIAFAQSLGGGMRVVDPDGSNLISITANQTLDVAWAPDSSQLAYIFAPVGGGGARRIMRVLPTGGTPVEVTTITNGSNRLQWIANPLPTGVLPFITPLVITGTVDRSPDVNGWYTSPVTITWDVFDPPPSPTPPVPATLPPTIAATDGSNLAFASDQSCNSEGICLSGSVRLNVDMTAPIVAVTGVADGRSYYEGFVPVPGCSASDPVSGVATQPTLDVADHGDGSFTASCTGTTDNAGNANDVSAAYTVLPHQTPEGQIFHSGNSAVNPDGTDNHGVFPVSFNSTFANDGSKVAFAWRGPLTPGFFEDTYHTDTWTVNSDGTGMTDIAPTNIYEQFNVAWSPDKTKIATAYGVHAGSLIRGVYVMNADGSNEHLIQPSAFYASFSPDSSRIVVGGPNISIYNVDGTFVRTVGNGYAPQWSPDGTRISYISLDRELVIVDIDGSNATVIDSNLPNQTDVAGPSWSPDSTEIAYQKNGGLYRIPDIGGSPIQVLPTITGTFRQHIQWLPQAIPPVPVPTLPDYPTVRGQTSPPRPNGFWYTAPVTVIWTASHSSGQATTPSPTLVSTEGVKQKIFSGFSCSPAGDCGYSYAYISLDFTAPAVTLAGPQDGAAYDEGSVPETTCTTTDAVSGVADVAVPSVTDNGNHTFTATCGGGTDVAGNTAAPVSVTYTINGPDSVPPNVTGTPDRVANDNNWYNAPVTIAWSAQDPEPSSGTPTTPPDTNASTEGQDVVYTSDPSCDPANNCASGTITLSIDSGAPEVSVTGVSNGATYLEGNVPTAGCSTADTLSGVATNASVQVTNNGGGSYTATCSGATDRADNAAPPISVSYMVVPPVYNVATNNKNQNGNSSITAAVGLLSGAGVGETLTISVTAGKSAGAAGCSDSKGNVYGAPVADKLTSKGRLFICSAKITNALTSGDTITATYPTFNGTSLISVNGISYLATTGVVDATATNSANSASPTSSAVTTTQAAEVIFGVVAHNSTPVFTPGAGFTLIGQVVSAGLMSGQKVTLSPEFKLVTSSGSYEATGTLSFAQQWRAAVVAYKSP